MYKDPIVEEIRRVRNEIEAEYPDVATQLKHIREKQATEPKRLVSRGPRPRRERKVG